MISKTWLRRILILLNVLFLFQTIEAQYKFYVSISWNYNCHGVRECEEVIKRYNLLYNNYLAQYSIGFKTRNECETARSTFVSIMNNLQSVVSSVGARIHFTTTPCSGLGNESFMFLGPNRGSSFHSPNIANEIQDWSKDYIEQLLALDTESKYSESMVLETNDHSFDEERNNLRKEFVLDTDKPFISINMRESWRSSSPDLDILNVELKPVQFINETELFDEEIFELERDWMKLGKDILLYSYVVSKNVAASSAAVLSLTSDFTINLYSELYKAFILTNRGEEYYADPNIFTETAIYWGGETYAITGNVIYNTAAVTWKDVAKLCGQSVTGEITGVDDMMEKSYGVKNTSDLISIAVDAADLLNRTYDYKEKKTSE